MYAVQKENHPQMTEAEYLVFDESRSEKYEYCRGEVYAMTGGSIRHGVITVNTSTQFNLQLADRGCSVSSPDTRVHISGKDIYRYPDVTVFCGRPAYIEGRIDTITNPIVLVEVLSPSSALLDRNEKLAEYTEIESLQAYLMIAQDKVKIESFQRHDSGRWLYQNVTDIRDEISVLALDCSLMVARIYANIDWDDVES